MAMAMDCKSHLMMKVRMVMKRRKWRQQGHRIDKLTREWKIIITIVIMGHLAP